MIFWAGAWTGVVFGACEALLTSFLLLTWERKEEKRAEPRPDVYEWLDDADSYEWLDDGGSYEWLSDGDTCEWLDDEDSYEWLDDGDPYV